MSRPGDGQSGREQLNREQLAGICERYLDSFGTGDADLVASFVAESFVNEHTAALGSGCVGRDEYRKRLPNFMASMPGLRYEIETQVVDVDTCTVANAYTLHARVNDRDVAVRGLLRIHIDPVSGLILDRTDYWDSKVFLKQAGME